MEFRTSAPEARFSLTLQEFSLPVFIGCHEEEKKNPQEVRLKIEITSNSLLKAAETDKLQDTFCYAELLEKVRGFCTSRHFDLVEHLAWSCQKFIKESLQEPALVLVRAHKVTPPVEGLNGGVVFEYGDRAE
ncbi:MAG: dihydroneopterin aldolase [Bdellovibrionales bacterium]|nr:dihydroneopterin aldolase [Bdellovibrionales bacterium]